MNYFELFPDMNMTEKELGELILNCNDKEALQYIIDNSGLKTENARKHGISGEYWHTTKIITENILSIIVLKAMLLGIVS